MAPRHQTIRHYKLEDFYKLHTTKLATLRSTNGQKINHFAQEVLMKLTEDVNASLFVTKNTHFMHFLTCFCKD